MHEGHSFLLYRHDLNLAHDELVVFVGAIFAAAFNHCVSVVPIHLLLRDKISCKMVCFYYHVRELLQLHIFIGY